MAAWRESVQSRVHREGATSFIIQLILLLCGHLQDAQGQGRILFHHISQSERPRRAKIVLQHNLIYKKSKNLFGNWLSSSSFEFGGSDLDVHAEIQGHDALCCQSTPLASIPPCDWYYL